MELNSYPNNNYPKLTIEEVPSQVPMLVDKNLSKDDDECVDEEDQDIIDSFNGYSDPQSTVPPRKGKQKKLAMSMKVMKKPRSRQLGLLVERNRVYSSAYQEAQKGRFNGGRESSTSQASSQGGWRGSS